jgi:hypothetical protein
MRDLPCFGDDKSAEVNRWPSQNDIYRMPKDKPIAVKSFMWKFRESCISALQVKLTNGVESPVFTANDEDPYNLEEFVMPKDVAKVRGTNREMPTLCMIFMDNTGKELGRMETYEDDSLGPVHDLLEGESIIGFYCDRGWGTGFNMIGLIVRSAPNV